MKAEAKQRRRRVARIEPEAPTSRTYIIERDVMGETYEYCLTYEQLTRWERMKLGLVTSSTNG